MLATWPSDKSIKHALVSLVLAKIGPKETLVLAFAAAAPPASAKFVPAVDLRSLTFRTDFEDKDGGAKTTTAIGADTLAQIAGILEGKITGAEAKKLAPRLCGPVCYEFENQGPGQDRRS